MGVLCVKNPFTAGEAPTSQGNNGFLSEKRFIACLLANALWQRPI
jgi:hypothetical protein